MLGYVASGGCDVVGLGDTRLGSDAAKMVRMARGVMGRVSDEQRRRNSAGLRQEQRAVAMAQRRKVGKVQWDSAGSHKDENEIWRGGVTAGSYGEAEARTSGSVLDCRGWRRYPLCEFCECVLSGYRSPPGPTRVRGRWRQPAGQRCCMTPARPKPGLLAGSPPASQGQPPARQGRSHQARPSQAQERNEKWPSHRAT